MKIGKIVVLVVCLWAILIGGSLLMNTGQHPESAASLPTDPTRAFEEIAEEGHRLSFIPRSTIEEYYDRIGPEKMIEILDRDPACHSEAHNLGKVIYIRTQDIGAALEMCDNSCTGGCYDGLFMGMFEDLVDNEAEAENSTTPGADLHISLTEDNRTMVVDRLLSICAPDTTLAQHYGIGACVHNLGHAVMYLSNYDTQDAEELCKIYNTPGEVFYCMTGIFMEHNITSPYSPESFHPCDTGVEVPAACYRYEMQDLSQTGTERHPENAAVAIEHCLSIEDDLERHGCFYGYAYNFNRNLEDNPNELAAFCGYGDDNDRRACIEAAAGGLRRYGASFIEQACRSVNESHYDACIEASKTGNFGMNRDFVDFYNVQMP